MQLINSLLPIILAAIVVSAHPLGPVEDVPQPMTPVEARGLPVSPPVQPPVSSPIDPRGLPVSAPIQPPVEARGLPISPPVQPPVGTPVSRRQLPVSPPVSPKHDDLPVHAPVHSPRSEGFPVNNATDTEHKAADTGKKATNKVVQ